ncbi:MAG: hypothetical protein KDK55_06875, partial [Chlamydiia bacterium]|nr:hypothetical protein [Chlamydiia bacterium]
SGTLGFISHNSLQLNLLQKLAVKLGIYDRSSPGLSRCRKSILEVEWVYFSIEEEKKVKGVCT